MHRLTLKSFKQLVQQTPLINIYQAPVFWEINDLYVKLSWRGTNTGALFNGGVNSANLREAKIINANTISLRLASLNAKNEVVYATNDTIIQFWHRVEMPIF